MHSLLCVIHASSNSVPVAMVMCERRWEACNNRVLVVRQSFGDVCVCVRVCVCVCVEIIVSIEQASI